MATAKKTQVVSVTLTLDHDEAQFLADILNRVGGPVEGRRKHADELTQALKAVGLERDKTAADVDVNNRAIYFLR